MLLHEILVHSANESKRKIAARCSDDSITYEELDDLSNKLCHCLIDKGIEVGDRVCIYLDKSIYSLISIFGILKSGATYVPLDPGAPTNRVITIINNSKPAVILSTSVKITKILNDLSGDSGYRLILCDNNEISNNNKYPKELISYWRSVLEYDGLSYTKPEIIEADSAYMLYTSGSTGTPKGVVVSHRASFVFVEWAYNKFRLLPGDILSNHAPLHFDLSIFDIFATMMAGATVILIPPSVSLFPHNLSSLISKSRINIWYSVPSMLVKMILYGKLDKLNFSNLRLVLFAGEVFPTKYLQKLIELIPHASFYNLYGPTETNVCTYYEVDKKHVKDPLPIGRPCPYNRFSLLEDLNYGIDNNLNNTNYSDNKINITEKNIKRGELCIQGPNVMSGYWGQDTTDKLVNGLYHTGDFVEKDSEDDLVYLSRIDGMIKTRGYRIELEEIESVLHNHPEISRSVVVPVPDLESTNLIHAFVVPNIEESKINDKVVKSFCSKYLPRYMVPAFVTFLSEIPETHNGKINRVKLKQIAIEK
jgi:amino acid adenylation domain-containing protein